MNYMLQQADQNEANGRAKKLQAQKENDRFKEIEGREEERLGQLQKEFGQDEEAIVEKINENKED